MAIILGTSFGGIATAATITFTGNENRVLVVAAGNHQGNVTGVGLNGTALTKIVAGSSEFNERVELWFYNNPPASTVGTISGTFSGGSGRSLIGAEFYNVSQSSQPIGSANLGGNSSGGSVSIVTPTNNNMLVGAIYSEGDFSGLGAGQTSIADVQGASYENAAASYEIKSAAGTEVLTYTISSDQRWAMAAIALEDAGIPLIQSSTGTSSSLGTFYIQVPSGVVDGDLLIMSASGDLSASEDLTYNAGTAWTTLLANTRSHATNAGNNLQVWYRVASSEPGSYPIIPDHANLVGATMIRINGQDASDPFDVSSILGFDDGTEAKIQPITTTVNNTRVIGITTWDQSKTLTSLPSGWGSVVHVDVSGHDVIDIQKAMTSAGDTGTAQFDLSSAAPYVSAVIAVQPTQSAPPDSNFLSHMMLMGAG